MSRKSLITLIITLLILFILVFFNLSWLKKIYFYQNKTSVGLVINSIIVVIFIIGIVKIFYELINYMKEEKAIERFKLNCKNNISDRLLGVDKNSFIAKRYLLIQDLVKKGIIPDIKILSTFLLTSESNRKTLVEYIDNILILIGVFGTVISLIIALIGASGFIKMTDEKSMALIIHGMSTALNTTFTAILCYFIFHYFFSKVNQIQDYLALKVEEITYFDIYPEIVPTEEKIKIDIENTLIEIKDIANRFNETQEGLKEYATKFSKLMNLNYEIYKRLESHLEELKLILKEGFRLK